MDYSAKQALEAEIMKTRSQSGYKFLPSFQISVSRQDIPISYTREKSDYYYDRSIILLIVLAVRAN